MPSSALNNRNLSSSRSPFDVGSPPSVLMRFQGYWGWFRSRKPGLISRILRGKCFVLWNGFVKSNIVGQKQDGVIALGASYIRELMSGFFINRLGDSYVK